MIATIFFNLLLFAMDLAALYCAGRSKSAPHRLFAVCFAILAEILLAAAFSGDCFDLCRLGCYLVFLHGFVFTAGFALLLWRKRKKTAIISGVCAAALPALAYYAFIIEPFRLETTCLKIADHKIETPFRIAVLADLQTDNFGDHERGVLRQIMQEKPDLILLAGDYIQATEEKYAITRRELNAFMREIGFSAPYGVFAVRGNVDGAGWPEIFADLGVNCVEACQRYDLGPLNLTCLGLSNSFNVSLAISNPDPSKYHLVLGHAPDFASGRIEADLLIAGHTHGGQVCFPLFGPVITNSRVPRSWAAGLTELPNGGKLLVSRGIGMERDYAPRIRFLCRPELVIIDLLPQKR
jgi:predicted MPP superfamily phosphohydrolase